MHQRRRFDFRRGRRLGIEDHVVTWRKPARPGWMDEEPYALMPEELEKQIKPEEMVDLFAFLALDKPPSDPSARQLPGLPAPAAR